EGGEAAYCCGSGMGALAIAFLALLKSGDEILATTDLYGGTPALLNADLQRFGVTTRYVDSRDPDAFTFTDRTKLVVVEPLSNPTVRVCDVAAGAQRAPPRGLGFRVDNTT